MYIHQVKWNIFLRINKWRKSYFVKINFTLPRENKLYPKNWSTVHFYLKLFKFSVLSLFDWTWRFLSLFVYKITIFVCFLTKIHGNFLFENLFFTKISTWQVVFRWFYEWNFFFKQGFYPKSGWNHEKIVVQTGFSLLITWFNIVFDG